MSQRLSPAELYDLEITERVASCFSLVGTSFILFTFLYSPAFRKPVNRLIFYASWGNCFCNIATLMSQSGIQAGQESPLCQFQAFLIQMFLPADALWNLAMAINVYMTLFRKYNAQQLKTLEWKYNLMCYGLTFLIALVYLFIETKSRGKMYGPATLWCWIDIEWVAFRIALCYAPAWCCIIISLCIYTMAGREIFAKRKQLRAFSNPSPPVQVEIQNTFTSFKTTEICVTSELATINRPNIANVFLSSDRKSRDLPSPGSRDEEVSPGKSYDQYSVTIRSTPMSPRFEVPQSMPRGQSTMQQRGNRVAMDANTAAWGYTKVALLFFVSLLVTWVPSSINRVYSLIHPSLVSLPFTYASGIVLPLMGFWNSVIYVTTSWSSVCLLFSGKLSGNTAAKRTSVIFSARPSQGSHRRRTGSESESDSVKGLALGNRDAYDQV